MRKNLPVTDVETLLPEHEFIYSQTDLKGVIVEANEAFAAISGFTRDEMIGQSHNIVRHPDMPEAAFADMWHDLKAGRPWRGIVKNRRKDGGFYWVVANVGPVREKGQVVGYQSVRSRPSREEVNAASDAYQTIRRGNKRLSVKHGRAIKARPAWASWAGALPVQMSAIALVALLSATAGLAALYSDMSEYRTPLVVLHAFILIYGLSFMLLYAPRVNRELSGFANWLGAVLSTGNLRIRIDSARDDVLGAVIRRTDKFASSLQATVQGMADIAKQVSVATDEVRAGMQQIQASAMSQAESTSAAAAAVEEITVSIAEVAEHAQSTKTVASDAAAASNEGVERSQSACNAITALSLTVASAAEQVEMLGQRSDEISKIASVINEIADQTNLLALNAAIEAARAGEVGRGFAVVADEVRKLAERTSTATHEISSTIQMIQGETRLAVQAMRAGAAQVEESATLVHSAQEVLQRIHSEMTDTTARVNEISHASSEQSAAMTQLAQNVEQAAAMTDQNVSVVSQANAMVEQLDQIVERMNKSANQFVL